MPAGLLLEFEGVSQKDYDVVSQKLGIDMKTGKGDWPPGQRSHTGGLTSDGVFIVTEVWESQADQERFMQERLGPALQEEGVRPPTRIVWFDVLAHHEMS